MRGVWITAAIVALNWAAAMLLSDPNSSVPPDHTLQWWWTGYAAVALAVTGLVATRHEVVGFWLAIPLLFFTIFSPWFIGIGMLPSSIAAMTLSTRASMRGPRAPMHG